NTKPSIRMDIIEPNSNELIMATQTHFDSPLKRPLE
ncbi:MAG: hypothetical protein ACI9TA_001406, partial [Reinekea sp.]